MGTVNGLSNQELAYEIRSLEAKVRPYEEEPEAEDDGVDSKRLSELRSELATRVRTTRIKLDAVNNHFLNKQEEAIKEFITIYENFANYDSLMAELEELENLQELGHYETLFETYKNKSATIKEKIKNLNKTTGGRKSKSKKRKSKKRKTRKHY